MKNKMDPSIEVLKQGAEARIYVGEYNGEKCVVKERFIKKYRHADLDSQLTKQRMKAETRAAARCQIAGIPAPHILHMDLRERKIYMEYFGAAITVKEYIARTVAENTAECASELLNTLCVRIGGIIGKMHGSNIIHGDLTTSNILINPQGDDGFQAYDVVFIDFGLSHYNESAENKAVDLYVLERAMLSAHSEQPFMFTIMLEAYRKECKDEKTVFSKFEEVRARGRKRTMIG